MLELLGAALEIGCEPQHGRAIVGIAYFPRAIAQRARRLPQAFRRVLGLFGGAIARDLNSGFLLGHRFAAGRRVGHTARNAIDQDIADSRIWRERSRLSVGLCQGQWPIIS
jgi:hypothetical protein